MQAVRVFVRWCHSVCYPQQPIGEFAVTRVIDATNRHGQVISRARGSRTQFPPFGLAKSKRTAFVGACLHQFGGLRRWSRKLAVMH